ncbi:MAG: ABC transporter permease subunit [Oscillospiraceae bacterium]|nr:ABC transporter permease subunit [Oscillospiraceae bacterium]
MSATARNNGTFGKNKKSLARRMWDARYMYLLVLPGFAFFILFRYVPMYGIQLAFKDFRSNLGITSSPWVGMQNFESLFINNEFWFAVRNTIIISYMQIVFFFPFPIVLAILLNELRLRKFKRVTQTIFTFPHFLSWVLVAGIVMNILSMNGAINNLIYSLGGVKYQFLTDKALFRYILIFFLTWKQSGWSCILYLAAITAIDPALYEAATIDGANRWHRIRYITWPGISTIVVVTFILRIGYSMDAGFDQIINMYNPTVYEVADIIDTYIYRITFQRPSNFGLSTAVGLFKGVTNCILLLSANFIAKKFNGTGIV